jgi:small multidrug resistance pump
MYLKKDKTMPYLYLSIAIIAEVIATTALKASAEFTRPIPSILVIVGYGVAFYLLSLVLRSIPVGITYAVWSGVGIVLITIVSWVLYKQSVDLPAVIGMAMIIGGVAVINIFSKTVGH